MGHTFNSHIIDHVEIFAAMAKPLAYWHVQALGFRIAGYAGPETGQQGMASYFLVSNNIHLVITTAFPTGNKAPSPEISSYIALNHCGVKRFALHVDSVKDAFAQSVAGGAIPTRVPARQEDEHGYVDEAAIKLYDHNEIVFINRNNYQGVFKPGYMKHTEYTNGEPAFFTAVDHIASELRVNEINFWTAYLGSAIGTTAVQKIERGGNNKTGMILNINQSPDRQLTLVMAEPESSGGKSKVQQNIENFGPGIHHLAFATNDLVDTVKRLKSRGVDFIKFPRSYYELLRGNEELKDFDIDALEQEGILIDKEDDTYLLQKFVKPISDRPFFFYEIVQRVNGYNGFALKNINVLKKAEEMEIMDLARTVTAK